MRSIDYDCYVDGCDAARRSGRIFCGAHWYRLSFELRGKLSRASQRLERRESAIARYGWTGDRQDAVDEAGEELIDAQREALSAVEALENVHAAA